MEGIFINYFAREYYFYYKNYCLKIYEVILLNKIGIIGGSGYIGSSLSKYLSKYFKVKIIDIKSPPKYINNNIDYKKCDILNYKEVKNALNDINLVIHTAIIQIPLINISKKVGYDVNIIGTQNICKAIKESTSIKGIILAGTWHVFGEDIKGIIDEGFGFRPDKVEDRARLYCLSKVAQEVILRMYDEFSSKIYGVIRLGTVLGERMSEKTAANIFITKGLKGEAITPYKHSMYRPMLYVDINDVCRAFHSYSLKILNEAIQNNQNNSLIHVINLVWPKPLTILELAKIIQNSIIKITHGKINPPIEIVDKGLISPYNKISKENFNVNINKAQHFLNLKITNPKKSIERIIKNKISTGILRN